MGPPTKLWGFFKKSYPAHNPRDPVLTFDQLPRLDTEIEIEEHRHNRKLGTATIKTKHDRLFRLHRGLYNRGGSHELDAEDYDWLVVDQHHGDGRYPRPHGQAELPSHHFPKSNPDDRPKTVPSNYSFERTLPRFEDTRADLHKSAHQLRAYNERIKTAEDREKSRASRISANISSVNQGHVAIQGKRFFESNSLDDFQAVRPTTAPEFDMKPLNTSKQSDFLDHTIYRYNDDEEHSEVQQVIEEDPVKPTAATSQRPGTTGGLKEPFIPSLIEADRVKPGIGLDGVPVLNKYYDQDLEELEKMTVLRLHGKESVMNMRPQTLYPIDAVSNKRVPVSHMESIRYRSTRPFGYAMEIRAKKREEAKDKVREFIRSNTTGANKARAKANNAKPTPSNGSNNVMSRSQTAPSNNPNKPTLTRSGSALLIASLNSANNNASPGKSSSPNVNVAVSRADAARREANHIVEIPLCLSADSFDNRDFTTIYEQNLQEVMSFDDSDFVQDNIHAIVLRSDFNKTLEPVSESKATPGKSPAVPKLGDFSPSSPFLDNSNRPMSARRFKQSTPFIEDIPFDIELLKESLTENLPTINTNTSTSAYFSQPFVSTVNSQHDQQEAQQKLSLEIPNNLEELIAGRDQPFQAVEERAVTEDVLSPLKRQSVAAHGKSASILHTRSSSFLVGSQVSVPHAASHHVTESTTSSHSHPVLSRAGSSSYMLMRVNSNRSMLNRTNSMTGGMTAVDAANSPAKSSAHSPNLRPISGHKNNKANHNSSNNNMVLDIPPVAFTFDAVGHIQDIHFKSQIPKARPSSADRLHRKKRETTPAEEAERHRMILEEQERKASLQSNRKDLLNLHMIDEIDARNERHTLSELYRICGGKQWVRQDNWNSDKPVREWYGVCLTVEGYVFELHLSSNNLSGPFPDIICDFPKLEVVQFDNNHLTGVLPDYCLQNCRNLRILSVRNNQMSGLLPFDLLTDLIFLEELWLSQNKFSGHLQVGLYKLQSLTHLCLKDNNIGGEIPMQLSKLKHLKYLSLGKNKFTGSIPKSFISLHNLETLSVFSNQLSGPVPEWIFSIPTLEEIELFDNPHLIIPDKLPIKVQ